MNAIRKQLLASGNVKRAADDAISQAKRPVRAVRGNDVTEAKRRKALMFLMRGLVENV